MGKYVTNNLVSNEQIAFETSYHWIIYCNVSALFTLFIAPLVASRTSEFAITNKRVIIKTGWLSRRTLEMNLSKIESVNVNQNLLGRILNYGDIRIIGTGGTNEIFVSIKRPLQFRRMFQELSN